jgi:hypothetical protein
LEISADKRERDFVVQAQEAAFLKNFIAKMI